jgi:hypothetical protein
MLLFGSLHVTTKTATPTKVDSKLSDAHLESLKRGEGRRENATKARSRVKCGEIVQKILLSKYKTEWYAIYTTQ